MIRILRGLRAAFRDSPDISFEALVKSFRVQCCSVVHCGAGLVEEAETYHRTNFGPIFWIEAHPDISKNAKTLLAKFPNQMIVEVALWDCETVLNLNVASNLGSSSLLKSRLHSDIFPDITFQESIAVKTNRLDKLSLPVDYGSLLVMDLQGAELKALHGAIGILQRFDYIYIEVSELELYEGAPRISDLNKFLSSDFKLVDWQISKAYHYGNLFFIRNELVKNPRLRRFFRFFHSFRFTLREINPFRVLKSS